MIKRWSPGKRFDRAAEISRQINANLGIEVSRHTVSRHLSQVGLEARSRATIISKKVIARFTQPSRVLFKTNVFHRKLGQNGLYLGLLFDRNFN